MTVQPYRRVLSDSSVRSTLALGVLVRVPLAAAGVLITLHVVSLLGRSYSEAGLVTLVSTVAVAIASPWRGRLLDTRGLRRTLLPSIAMMTICWSIAPFVGYWPLIVLAAFGGLFSIPAFSIIRQAVIVAVPDHDRRTALALDAVAVELSFMIGPLLGVWAGTHWPTSWVLFAVQMLAVLGGIALYIVNPPVTTDDQEAGAADRVPLRTWFTPGVATVMVASAAATVVLTGTDIGLVAALRETGQVESLGIVVSIWCIGSAVGGLVYGALHRPVPAFALLFVLAATTLPLAWAHGVGAIIIWVLLAGVFCAPTLTATVDQLSRIVPEANRGEAIGWHGAFLTAGTAVGAPIAGFAIDHSGPGAGFLVVAVLGMLAAVLGSVAVQVRRRGSRSAAVTPVPGDSAQLVS